MQRSLWINCDDGFTLCFIGHTHRPLPFSDQNEAFGEAHEYEMDEELFVMGL